MRCWGAHRNLPSGCTRVPCTTLMTEDIQLRDCTSCAKSRDCSHHQTSKSFIASPVCPLPQPVTALLRAGPSTNVCSYMCHARARQKKGAQARGSQEQGQNAGPPKSARGQHAGRGTEHWQRVTDGGRGREGEGRRGRGREKAGEGGRGMEGERPLGDVAPIRHHTWRVWPRFSGLAAPCARDLLPSP